MIVKCFKTYDSITREPIERTPWLTIGKEYVVLSLEVRALSVENRVYLSIQSDDGANPVLFEADQFVTVSSKMPANWVISLDEFGNMNIEPQKWSRPGFWEDYFNFDEDARQDFEDELKVILRDA